MPNLSSSPNLAAGLVLAALPLLADLELLVPSASAVIEATGASRTTAYKIRGALYEALPTLIAPPGRPVAEEPPPVAEATELHRKVLQFVFDHPGCVSGTSLRRHYAEVYHVFVLDLFAAHREVTVAQLAEVVGVPLPTLKDWIRGDRPQVEAPQTLARPPAGPSVAHVETVLQAYRSWRGTFKAFCNHVQFHCRIPISRQHISDILQAHGIRIPKRRGGRPADASALRGAFDTFHPGAQWIGDGTELVVTINGQAYVCNLQLNVDVSSGAFVGASVRPTEDSAAVVQAFADGVATTGAPPLALLLDNKPSNHTDEVVAALGDTIKLRARPYTPTDKPHVEGAFGLFAQQTPQMNIDADDYPASRTRSPFSSSPPGPGPSTTDHGPTGAGRTRADLYRNARPTPEEIAHANARFAERLAAEDKARLTRERRADPLVRAALDEAFARLGLDDPEAQIRTALASWPLDAILAGIAVFEGRQRRGNLPDGADGRYLRGIVVNMATEAESMAIADALLDERLRARDRALAGLEAEHKRLKRTDDADAEWLVRSYVGRSMKATRQIDRLYWLRATADVVLDQLDVDQRPLLRLAARHISATHSLKKAHRDAAIRFLFAKAVPVS